MDGGAWWAAVHGVAKSQTRLSDFTFTFHFHALEKEMATHSSVLAWRIPGTAEPGGLLSLGSHRVGHDWSDLAAAACSFSSTTCWKEYLFLIGLLTLVEIHLNYSLFLWSLFYSVGLCLSLCQDHTVLVIAAYSRFWNQEYETFYFVIFQDYFRYLGSTEAIYSS